MKLSQAFFLVIPFHVLVAGFVWANDLDINISADIREGGETIADAFVIDTLPFTDTGVTCDNENDYDEGCPYTGSTSPDVVYTWTATFNGFLSVDLCGSQYDTKLYMYDAALNLVGCQDDSYCDIECGFWVSALSGVAVISGETYFIVVDGYGGDCGEYIIVVKENETDPPCLLNCPQDGILEGEPEIVDGYVDNYNGGCRSSPPIFQALEAPANQTSATFCGVAGYFDQGLADRSDEDWINVVATGSQLTWTVDAEQLTYCFVWSIPDCLEAVVTQSMTAGPCTPNTMYIPTTPGQVVTLGVHPDCSGCSKHPDSSCPSPLPRPFFFGYEYNYVFTIEGIASIVAVENHTWGRIKSLYR